MPKPEFDDFDRLLYEQAQSDPDVLEAYEYRERMRNLGYDVTLKEAGAYALAGTVDMSGVGLEASIERVASLASLLSEARHD